MVAVSLDRKSTRLNSSHGSISYAVFCLKKKKKNIWRPCACYRARMSSYLHRPQLWRTDKSHSFLFPQALHLKWLHSQNSFFFFNDTATTEIYTLSLHDALPI